MMSASADHDEATTGDATVSPVAVDRDLCKVCGICIELCPEHVFDRDRLGYPVIARPDDCTHCLLCELHCPDFAIAVQRRVGKRAAGAAAGEAEPPPIEPEQLATVSEPEGCASHHEEA
jgi:2-oxoglutarate ferredoxin oxidoreductase subunit delta